MAVKPETAIRRSMEALGTYKPEFDAAIMRYVRLAAEYDELYKRYIDDGMPFECETAQGTKKAPIVTTLEALRKDILTLEDALGLTPRGLLKLKDDAFARQKKSGMAGLFKGG